MGHALNIYVDDDNYYDEGANYGVAALSLIVILVVSVALCYGCGCYKNKLYLVDDQDLVAVFSYFLQIIDLWSDIIMWRQFREYEAWSDDDDQIPIDRVEALRYLYILSMVFVMVPYFANIASSMGVVQQIANHKVISGFSKKYFQDRSKLYSLLVLISGGSIRSLQLMNSNFLGLRIFSSGLSSIQMQQFRTHHLIGSAILQNVTQIAIQCFFMFYLNVYTNTVLIAFLSSSFNLLLFVCYEIAHCFLNWKVSECPITILLVWDGQQEDDGGTESKNKDHRRTGGRKKLAKALSALNYGDDSSIDVELLSSEPKTGSSIIYGVLRFDQDIESEHDVFDRFKRKTDDISAIIECEWALRNLTDIDISMVSGSSRSEQIKLILDIMEGLGTERERMDKWLEGLNSKRRASIAMGTRIAVGTQMSTSDGETNVDYAGTEGYTE